MHDTNRKLRDLIQQRNREIAFESFIALAVGVGTTLLVFGVVFWLSWLGLWITRPLGLRHVALVSAVFTSVLFLVAVFTAWRRIDPLESADIQLADPGARDMQDALGFAMGIPILRRDSLAGIGSLLVGGPANVFDSLALWRSKLPASERSIDAATHVLGTCQRGLNLEQINEPRVVATLYRLGLIKLQTDSAGRTQLVLTAKGSSTLRQDA